MPFKTFERFHFLCLFILLCISDLSFSLQIYRTGSLENKLTLVTPMVCLAGGGNEAWSEGWKELMTSTHQGDLLIIRADGQRGEYESWLYEDTSHLGFPKVNSVSTLVIESFEDANSEIVEKLILDSELIFFVGGFQDIYYSYFNGSLLQHAIKKRMYAGEISIAGSSAGMAILGGINFLARYNSPTNTETGYITSEDVMIHPTEPLVDLTLNFMTAPWMGGILTETHLIQRNRMGRMVGFMARAAYNYAPLIHSENIRAIGLDVNTAFCYSSNSGIGKIYGTGLAVFAQGNAPIERITQNTSLHWYAEKKAVKVFIIDPTSGSNSFDLKNWNGYGGHEDYWWVDGSSPENPQFGSSQ